MRKVFIHTYNDIISVENLLFAWQEFIKGKRQRKDVQEFERDLIRNIIALHNNLIAKTYKHAQYEAFTITDPKLRNIHKAEVKDRLLHHAIHRMLYPYFDKKFIYGSYSCRNNKGTHKAINYFRDFMRKVSINNTRTCWVLKCDIRKFFNSIDHKILLCILEKYIIDKDILWLLENIIRSFHIKEGKGLPLGNLTSQLFVNIYMNEFDQYIKHEMKVKYYIRYADDFVVCSTNKNYLQGLLKMMRMFLKSELELDLHPQKVSINTSASGIDFLGWVHFPDHRVLRTVTKRRMLKVCCRKEVQEGTIQSYFGMLGHGNTRKLQGIIEKARKGSRKHTGT